MKFESILSEPFNGLEAFDKLVVIAFYLTIVFAVLFVAVAFAVKKLNREKLPDYFKGCKFFAIGYGVAFAILMAVLKMSEIVAAGEFYPSLFWPIAAVFITAFLLFAVGYFLSLAKPEILPKYKFIALIIILIPVIVSIAMLAVYYKTVAEYYSGVSQAGLYVSAVLLIAVLVIGTMFLSRKKGKQMSTRELAYAAITIAMSFALSYVRFFKLPQGGSVTLASMLPIMLFSYMFGIKKGVVVGVIYGVLQAIQDPWIIHPAQFLLDYPIAFGMIGFAGLFHELGFFKKKPIIAFSLGAIIAVFLRYICHVLSGIFAFSSYAAAGYSAVAWGFLYNAFTFADLAIVLVVGVLMFASRSFVKLIDEKSADDVVIKIDKVTAKPEETSETDATDKD